MITPEQIIASIFYAHISLFGLPGELDMKEAKCLADNVYFEAKGQPAIGQSAVAHVTLNRVGRDDYPDTICGVVWQKACAKRNADVKKFARRGCTAQFTWTWDGKPDKIYIYNKHGKFNEKVYEAYYIAAYEAIMALLGITNDPTNGASHYYNSEVLCDYKNTVKKGDGCHPRWAFKKGFVTVGEIYDHTFLINTNGI